MRKSYYVMHKLLRYANNLLRYAAIITLCVVITFCGVTDDHGNNQKSDATWRDKVTR